jgi:hypothetical protein
MRSIRSFFLLFILAICSWSCDVPTNTVLNHSPAEPGLVPSGRFKNIHFIAVPTSDVSQDIREHLAQSTCFKVAQTAAQADAVLTVEMFLEAPQGREHYTLGEMNIIYKAKLIDHKSTVLWKGSESTHQKMIPGPGLNLPPGTNFYKDVMPLDAKLLLLLDLKSVACAMPEKK